MRGNDRGSMLFPVAPDVEGPVAMPSRSWIYYAIAIAGLPLSIWAYAGQARLAAIPAEFPPEGTGYPVQFQGISADSREEVRYLAEGFPPGREVVLVDRGGRESRLPLPRAFSTTLLVVTLMSGLIFWGVSAFVFAPRASNPAVRDFFWCTFLYGIGILVGGVHFPGEIGNLHRLGGVLEITCLAALPAIFVHLTLVFPRRREILDRAGWIPWLLVAVAAALAISQSIAFLRHAAHPSAIGFSAMMWTQKLADLLLVLQVAAGFAILFLGSRRLELTRERAQVKWLLWGFAIGVTPYVFLRTLFELIGVDPPFGAEFDRILELAIPLAFIGAVVRYRFLDIDIIIRRSVIYGFLAAGLVLLSLATAVFLGGKLESLAKPWRVALPIGVGVAAGIAFRPLRDWIGLWIDRTFFKIRHGHGEALAGLRPMLEAASSERGILVALDGFFAGIFRPRIHAAATAETQSFEMEGIAPAETIRRSLAWIAGGATIAARQSTSLPEIESDLPEELTAAGIILVEPICAGGEVAGAIFLGRRETERRYIEPDLGLIRSAALDAGRAIERIRLVQRAAEDVMARRRSEEMNRLKGEFLARVAHDLRTPLASISWSTDNLLDGLAGAVSGRQEEYLRSVKASVGHLGRLVTSLLEVSRIEQGRAEFPVHRVDLRPVIDQALLAIRPLAEEKGIELAIEVDQAARPVQGSEEKLAEIVINLVDNAIRFGPSGSRVEITLPAPSGGCQALVIRDHGEGFKGVDPETLFAQYRQGAPSIHGGGHGFGLGLFIVRTYVERMGGSIRAAEHPDGGAILTCLFAIDPSGEGVEEANP